VNADQIIIVQAVVSIVAVVGFGIYAQYKRILAEDLADGLLSAYQWIDEIIEALEDNNEARGNVAIDNLINKRRADEE
jgi:hypothetical protein